MTYALNRSLRAGSGSRCCLMVGLLMGVLLSGPAAAEAPSWTRSLWERTRADHIEFYAGENIAWLYGTVVTAALLANTGGDRHIDEWYQDSIRNRTTDAFSRTTRLLGEGALTVPLFIGAGFAGYVFGDTPATAALEEWGERSLRSTVIGVPPMFFLQRVTRHSRPKAEKDEDWKTDHNKGVSGHAFMGAIPFISAAKMTDHLGLKTALYLGSMLCGYSRVNDEGHYVSHVIMGWGLAYLAETAVDRSFREHSSVQWDPWLTDKVVGVTLRVAF